MRKTSITFIGQAGFLIKSASGQLLAIDLYLSDCVEKYEGSIGFKRLLPRIINPSDLICDVLICTHPHLDHFDKDSFADLISNGKTTAFCSVDCVDYIENMNLEKYYEKIKYVKPNDSYSVGDFELKFVNCDHGKGAPDAVGVVVKVDGKTIYEAGDTCLRLDRINEIPKSLDVLIAPINGAFGNLNETECVMLSEALKPNITIPCHYGMFASHHGDVGVFYEKMIEKDLPFVIMQYGEEIVL